MQMYPLYLASDVMGEMVWGMRWYNGEGAGIGNEQTGSGESGGFVPAILPMQA